jgi:F-type H+-transporting ATPase subunit b
MEALGIDYRILIGQIINFLILLFIFKKFVFGPVLARLESRRATIDASLKKAEEMNVKETQLIAREKAVLSEASQQAAKFLSDAQAAAEQIKADILAKASEEQNRLIEKTKAQLVLEKNQMIESAKSEVTDLAIGLCEKILGQKLSVKDEINYLEKMLTK